VDYGLKGRYSTGPFQDIQDKYHDVSQIIDPTELTEYLRAPLEFKEFKAVVLWLITFFILTALVTIVYLVYIFTMLEYIEEGYTARTIYYIVLLMLVVVAMLGSLSKQTTLRSNITEYVEGINREVFIPKGVEMKFEYPWSCKGYKLTITRFKDNP
jgi:hypothetical protein